MLGPFSDWTSDKRRVRQFYANLLARLQSKHAHVMVLARDRDEAPIGRKCRIAANARRGQFMPQCQLIVASRPNSNSASDTSGQQGVVGPGIQDATVRLMGEIEISRMGIARGNFSALKID